MIVKAVFMIAVTGVVLGSLSLACSALFRRVQSATVAAYALTLGLLVGTALSYGAIRTFIQRNNPGEEVSLAPSRLPLLANPVIGVAVAVVPRGVSVGGSPLASLSRSARGDGDRFDNAGNLTDVGNGLTTLAKVIAVDVAFVAAGLLLASSRLRTPRMVDR